MKFSSSQENYLKAIYLLQQTHPLVTTNRLATALSTRPASVTDMLKKLRGQRLLKYERYKGFRLTAGGRKTALQIIRKHRLWEYFLVEKLAFGWEEVHEIAEELEHISSKKLIDRLDAYLAFPRTDPHGDPIPDPAGKIAILQQVPLDELPLHYPTEVTGIGEQSAELLELLRHKKIHLGLKLEVSRKFSFDESLELTWGNQAGITISRELAKNILVRYEEQNS